MRVADLESIRIKLASPEEILAWSHGEVTKPETINYRTQKPEKDGLFCEKIFGPEKDYECYCGKYRRIRYKGIICDKCGVEVTKSSVRRERMGHIKLATPVSHIWFLRGVPTRIGMVLDLPAQQLEKVIYFAAYIITKVNEAAKAKIIEEIETEYKQKIKTIKSERKVSIKDTKKKKILGKKEKSFDAALSGPKLQSLRGAYEKAKEEVSSIRILKILSEIEYHDFSLKYGEIFEAGTGAEALRKIFEKLDLKKLAEDLKKENEKLLDAPKRKSAKTPGGSPEVPKTINEVNRKNILRRLKLIQGMIRAKIRPEWMFITLLPILPPDLRPMVQLDGGRYAASDLNDLYRRVINRNNRLKYLLEINAPEVMVRSEKRMLQEAVDALIDNTMRKGQTTTATTGGKRLLKSLADILKGKQGRFRQNLLGKRVDYSGRSVIVVGPELRLHQAGIPKRMALELFKPFVIQKIIEKELAYNVRGASHLIDEETDEVWAILEEIVKDKLVLLNRAPTLHRLGIQAFYPILIEGEAIKIHPMVCKAFNADFDGDQMAVHLPLSEESQREAREIMLSSKNLLKPATGLPIVIPTNDMVLGCYWLTKIEETLEKGEKMKIYGNAEEAMLAYDFGYLSIKRKIKVRNVKGKDKNEFVETSLGRLIFNAALPEDFPFQNDEMNSKKLEKLISEIIAKYGMEKSEEYLDRIKNLGFEYSTKSGITWGMDDLIIPPQKKELIEGAEREVVRVEDSFKKGLLSKEEKSAQVIEVWRKTKSEIEKLILKTLPPNGPVFSIVDSGSRGSWSQPVQMAGMKGLVINPMGQIIELPIKSSFKEGFDVLEFFISTHGARKGTADTALRTSHAGYLTRRLVDVSHDIIINIEDCKDDEGIFVFRSDAIEIGQDFSLKVLGKTILEDIKINGKTIVKKGETIDHEKARKIADSDIDKVKIRSVLACKALNGVCQKCYGWDLGINQPIKLGEAVGIVAAQAIGEPGTQLTMKTFHMGGVAGVADITQGLPRVEEIFEGRPPVGKAVISQVEGTVIEVLDTPKLRMVKIKPLEAKKGKEILEYPISPKVAIWVKPGEKVLRGQQLCEGSVDLKELFKVAGQFITQRYIIKEIQKIYLSQGANILDKHVALIARQMFSRVRIKESGDSQFTEGEIVEKSKFEEENLRLKKEDKKPAVSVTIILGISRVALTCNSFLSAASFQETSRVLIKASLEGREDRLKGLKENVIIGKLIPAGTGFKKE